MSAGTTTECTLGEMLRDSRLNSGLSLRTAATTAGITPMYLSLIERDACGPPSDEKLQSLADALGEPHAENFFAKAGRSHRKSLTRFCATRRSGANSLMPPRISTRTISPDLNLLLFDFVKGQAKAT